MPHPLPLPTLLQALLCLASASLAYALARFLAVPLLHKITRKTPAQWDDVLLAPTVLHAACHALPPLILWRILPLALHQHTLWAHAADKLCSLWATLAIARTIILLLNALRQLPTQDNSTLHQYLQTLSALLKGLTLFGALIIIVALLLGRSPATLLASLGALSAVLMLVFKDTIEGLVAGVRLNSNNMLRIGDWITVPGTQVHGNVEEITLTTVKVRNFDNTILTVSPKTLVDGSFQNWRGMKERAGRRLKRTLHIDYRTIRLATPQLIQHLLSQGLLNPQDLQAQDTVNLTLFRKHVERLLSQHPDVEPQAPILLRQLDAADTGLPIEVYCFIKQQEWIPYEQAAARIIEQIIALAPEFQLNIYQRI